MTVTPPAAGSPSGPPAPLGAPIVIPASTWSAQNGKGSFLAVTIAATTGQRSPPRYEAIRGLAELALQVGDSPFYKGMLIWFDGARWQFEFVTNEDYYAFEDVPPEPIDEVVITEPPTGGTVDCGMSYSTPYTGGKGGTMWTTEEAGMTCLEDAPEGEAAPSEGAEGSSDPTTSSEPSPAEGAISESGGGAEEAGLVDAWDPESSEGGGTSGSGFRYESEPWLVLLRSQTLLLMEPELLQRVVPAARLFLRRG